MESRACYPVGCKDQWGARSSGVQGPDQERSGHLADKAWDWGVAAMYLRELSAHLKMLIGKVLGIHMCDTSHSLSLSLPSLSKFLTWGQRWGAVIFSEPYSSPRVILTTNNGQYILLATFRHIANSNKNTRGTLSLLRYNAIARTKCHPRVGIRKPTAVIHLLASLSSITS